MMFHRILPPDLLHAIAYYNQHINLVVQLSASQTNARHLFVQRMRGARMRKSAKTNNNVCQFEEVVVNEDIVLGCSLASLACFSTF